MIGRSPVRHYDKVRNPAGPRGIHYRPEERRAAITSFFEESAAHWRKIYSATPEYCGWEYKTRGRIALEWLAELGQLPGRRLLDLGCGLGIQSAAAAQVGWRVISVDFSTALLVEAQRYSQEPLWIAATMEALPFHSHTYDAVLMNGTIGYVDDPLQALGVVREQLRPGGRFIISWASPPPLLFEAVSRVVSAIPDAVYLGLKRLIAGSSGPEPLSEPGFYEQYLRRWTPDGFYELLEQAGFTIERVYSQNFGRLHFMDRPVWSSEGIDARLSDWLSRLAGTTPRHRIRAGARAHIALTTCS